MCGKRQSGCAAKHREQLASSHLYDLGCIDLEQKTLQLLDNPFGTRLLTMS
jgi:hypothetical protein